MDNGQLKKELNRPNQDDFKQITFGKEGMEERTFTASRFVELFWAESELVSLNFATHLRPSYDGEQICDILKHHGFTVHAETDVAGYEAAVNAHDEAQSALEASIKAQVRAYLSTLPLIGSELLIPPVASTKGSNGYGEGFAYGKKINGSREYFYRFAGKRIPRNELVYLTSEDGFFSRQKGDRQQLVVLWDEESRGFRVLLDHTAPHGFMAIFRAMKEKGIDQAIIDIGREAEQIRRAGEEMQRLIDSGVDLF